MMYIVSEEDEKWNFTEGDNWICLGIPYKSRNSWLHVLLPTQKFGLAALLKEFNSDLLKKCIMERNVKRIRITLPVFQIENKVDF
uniref:Serpin domain-containing protein n=1 Tax=Panagrolaimus superbus TaxID=310955 RepID=A0A914YKV2_9BILA